MKKVMGVSIFSVILIIAMVLIYDQFAGSTFKEVALKNVDESKITSIEIIRSPGDQEAVITDQQEIEALMGDFSEMKIEKADISNVEFDQSYWILIKTEDKRLLGFTYYDSSYLSLYDYNDEKNNGNYKIKKELIGGFKAEAIEDLFKGE